MGEREAAASDERAIVCSCGRKRIGGKTPGTAALDLDGATLGSHAGPQHGRDGRGSAGAARDLCSAHGGYETAVAHSENLWAISLGGLCNRV